MYIYICIWIYISVYMYALYVQIDICPWLLVRIAHANRLFPCATRCNTQHTAKHNTLQHTTHWLIDIAIQKARINYPQPTVSLQRTTSYCNTPHHTTLHCITLVNPQWKTLHHAIHCNKLHLISHYTPTHCIRLVIIYTIHCNTLQNTMKHIYSPSWQCAHRTIHLLFFLEGKKKDFQQKSAHAQLCVYVFLYCVVCSL